MDSFAIDGSGEANEDHALNLDDAGTYSILNEFIICERNKLYLFWRFLDVFCCLSSSCMYAYMAAFETPHPGSALFVLMWVFEAIFLVSMFLNFIVDYRNEGEERPVRDLFKIGKRYLNGKFVNDLVPLIPL